MKPCSCARSSTSASSLVFPTLTLVRAILLQAGKAVNNCSFFQIQLSVIWHFHPQILSSFFRNFHWKSQGRFRESQGGGIHLDQQPLPALTYVLIKRVRLLTEKRTLKASFPFRKERQSESLTEVQFCDLTAVVSLANQVI